MRFKCRKAFENALKAFCTEGSISLLKFLVNPQVHILEKCIWVLLEVALLSGALILIHHTLADVYHRPLVISLETINHPISNVPFPAIAICNINKISKKRAEMVALKLSQKTNLSLSYTKYFIKMLGAFYSLEMEQVRQVSNFNNYLEEYDKFDMYLIMKELNTPCEELLHSCSWKNKKRSCSDLFEMRRTYEGFCCAFNYVRHRKQKLQIVDKPGIDEGLTVMVFNEPDDYLYPIVNSIGVNVHIFNPHDYPDMRSGYLHQKLIHVGTENFLGIESSSIYSVPNVRNYPLHIRKCLFDDEVPTTFGNYSLSNCIVDCRVKSIIAMCECVPFMIPSPYANFSQCFLLDTQCLSKYEEKWDNLYPRGLLESNQLEREKQNSLVCNNCYAECSGIFYWSKFSFAPLHSNNSEAENLSIIRIYFESRYTELYKQDVVNTWYDILSNIGGLLSIFLGCSMITLMELLYFFTLRLKS